MDVRAATSTGDNKRCVSRKNRDWQKRLHLRKTAVQPPAMQSRDKRGPKKKKTTMMAVEEEEEERSAAWPSSQKTPQEEAQRCGVSRNTLRFTCSQCKDSTTEYVPKDLARHFEEKHRGSPPDFSCHTCPFTTHEFSYLQVHLLSHEDTFSSCSICHDNVQRTWPEFSAHLTMYHCPNGKYVCEVCQKFSTGDVRVFLEHVYLHNLGPEGANDELLLHIKGNHQFGPETTTQTLHCQHCGYEASQKWLITKHINAVHACQNGNQRRKKKKEEVHSIAVKPNDTVPKMKPRLTRSAVREMCWLTTQDCLSLPGREFLDKYCHLSDPQTTLEETQQFLMKSVAGETGDQKWTKALKTVLSNVPQDLNLHAKSENGIVSNSSDLTVLTVKNKITVGQNGATYAKRLKMMTSSDKEAKSPETAAGDVDQNGCRSDLSNHTPCPQAENKQHNDVPMSVQNEPSESVQMQENRENQELKTDQEIEAHGKKLEDPVQHDGIHVSSDMKLTHESEEQTSIQKAQPKLRRPNLRRRRKTRFKKADNGSPGLALKIVLKKNPVKEKQWVSQSSLSPSGRSDSPTQTETVEILQSMQPADAQQKKWTKGGKADLPSEAICSILQSEPGEELVGSQNVTGNLLEGSPSMHQEMKGDAENSQHLLESEVDKSTSAGGKSQARPRAASVTEVETCPESVQLQTSHCSTDRHVSGDMESSSTDGATPHSSSKSSSVSHPVITPQGEMNVEDSCHVLPAEQSDLSIEGMKDNKVPADPCLDPLSSVHSPIHKAIQQQPSPAASGHQRWQPAPKNLERTLKLVASNPSQLVKRPAGDQPVVVLNHPDADIPEVARIMEVINKYKGEVQKVVLSRRTLNALSALNGELLNTDDSAEEPGSLGEIAVQERFTLKLKLRRLSRKKYEVVDAAPPSEETAASATKFRCWFCGRIFTNQVMWMAHRQRHLMEWKSPNCENS